MPRIIVGHEHDRPRFPTLVDALADELRSNRPFGQPVIREQRFPKTNVIRTTVIWDRWEPLAAEDRIETIQRAYEAVEGERFRECLALAIGLTVPEAHDAGLLPVQVTAAWRKSDAVSIEQCCKAMISLGASTLANPNRPELRFATVPEAEQAVRELVSQLPASDGIWMITQETARMVD